MLGGTQTQFEPSDQIADPVAIERDTLRIRFAGARPSGFPFRARPEQSHFLVVRVALWRVAFRIQLGLALVKEQLAERNRVRPSWWEQFETDYYPIAC